jgi:hypothetical protein
MKGLTLHAVRAAVIVAALAVPVAASSGAFASTHLPASTAPVVSQANIQQAAAPLPRVTPSPPTPGTGPAPRSAAPSNPPAAPRPQPVQQPQAQVQAAPANSGGSSGGAYVYELEPHNLVRIGRYLMAHGYSRAAASGVAGTIAGESGGDPSSVGSGGCGLIGFTPCSSMSQYGGVVGNLASQERAVLNYNDVQGPVSELKAQTDPMAAADFYSQAFERPQITDSDVRPAMVALVYSALTSRPRPV